MNFKKGSNFTFGSWKNQLISWRVLDSTKDTVLCISEHVLEDHVFSKVASLRWENSEARRWLNTTFYQKAFNDIEKVKLLENKEGDKIWLLPDDDTDKYFPMNSSNIEENMLAFYPNGKPASWWLYDGYYVEGSDTPRAVVIICSSSDEKNVGMRPMILLDRKALEV